MKSLLKKLFFNPAGPNRIFSGVSSGMVTNYSPQDRTLHLLGLYEREIYSYLLKGIKNANTLIDVGANDGYYGLAFLKQKNKEVILCEPGIDEQNRLIENLKLNGFKKDSNFKLIDKFVTSKTIGNQISINDLIEDRRKVFILIDVDGGEQDIVEAFNFDSDTRIDWLIETHSLELEKSISATFIKGGYRVNIIKKAWWRIVFPEHRPLSHNRWLFASKN